MDDCLENKTVENCKAWILYEYSNSFLAERNGSVVGVFHVGHNGHVFLCYVLPFMKGLDIGGRLLSAAENSVIHLGIISISLQITVTAKGFYEHYGYIEIEDVEKISYLEYVK